MKTIQLEFFDVYNRKHKISVPASQKYEVFNQGYTIDASDVLGVMFVCDGDFILKPVLHSVRNQKNKEVYFCRVYDEDGNAVDVQAKKWREFLYQRMSQWNLFTANLNSINVLKSGVL